MTRLLILISALFVVTSCGKKIKNEEKEQQTQERSVQFYYECSFDTIKLNETNALSIKLISSKDHSIYDTENFGFKLLDGCIVFTTLDRVEELKPAFDAKCDSIFSETTKLMDTFFLNFDLIPDKVGKSKFLLNLKEIVYYKPSSDSISTITNTFYIEEEYYVEE